MIDAGSIWLPLGPSLNQIWRAAKVLKDRLKPYHPSKNPYITRNVESKEYVQWRRDLKKNNILMAQQHFTAVGKVELIIYYNKRKNEDISNRIKALEDALVYYDYLEDDKLVQNLRIHGDLDKHLAEVNSTIPYFARGFKRPAKCVLMWETDK